MYYCYEYGGAFSITKQNFNYFTQNKQLFEIQGVKGLFWGKWVFVN